MNQRTFCLILISIIMIGLLLIHGCTPLVKSEHDNNFSEFEKCNSQWFFMPVPSFQTVVWGEQYFSVKEYANYDRHFTFREGKINVNFYQMPGVLLIKDPSNKALGDLNEEQMWFSFGMGTLRPAESLAKAFPNGPCSIETKTPFSLDAPADEYEKGEIKETIECFIEPVKTNEFHYKCTVEVESQPWWNKRKTLFSGSMVYSVKEAKPPDNLNIKGYVIAYSSKSSPPVVGDAQFPGTTMGELRRELDIIVVGDEEYKKKKAEYLKHMKSWEELNLKGKPKKQ